MAYPFEPCPHLGADIFVKSDASLPAFIQHAEASLQCIQRIDSVLCSVRNAKLPSTTCNSRRKSWSPWSDL